MPFHAHFAIDNHSKLPGLVLNDKWIKSHDMPEQCAAKSLRYHIKIHLNVRTGFPAIVFVLPGKTLTKIIHHPGWILFFLSHLTTFIKKNHFQTDLFCLNTSPSCSPGKSKTRWKNAGFGVTSLRDARWKFGGPVAWWRWWLRLGLGAYAR